MKSKKMRLISLPRMQKGAVLIMGLIILLMLSLLSTSSLNAVIMEQRVSNSLHSSSNALQRAEAALGSCEKLLDELDAVSVQIGSVVHSASYARMEFGERWWRDEQFWLTQGMEVGDFPFDQQESLEISPEPPRCYIELITNGRSMDVMADGNSSRGQTKIFHFRVSAWSAGSRSSRRANRHTAVVLQSDVFKKMF